MAGLAAAAAAMAVAVPAAASASTAASPVVGHVYVNDNTAGANTIRAFDRHADGRLTPQAGSPFAAGSTVALPDGSQPGDVPFNGTGTKLVGTRVGTSLIDSFTVGRGGGLTAAPGSPFSAQGPGPFGSEFRPTNPDQLYVSNAHGGAGNGTVSAFSDSAGGTLSPDRILALR